MEISKEISFEKKFIPGYYSIENLNGKFLYHLVFSKNFGKINPTIINNCGIELFFKNKN